MKQKFHIAGVTALCLAAAVPVFAANVTLRASHQFPGGKGDVRDEMVQIIAREAKAANVGPAERNLRPFTSSGLRMQPFFDAMPPASQASESTMTPALSIFALTSFMKGESFTRNARSWLRMRPGMRVTPNARTLPLA